MMLTAIACEMIANLVIMVLIQAIEIVVLVRFIKCANTFLEPDDTLFCQYTVRFYVHCNVTQKLKFHNLTVKLNRLLFYQMVFH